MGPRFSVQEIISRVVVLIIIMITQHQKECDNSLSVAVQCWQFIDLHLTNRFSFTFLFSFGIKVEISIAGRQHIGDDLITTNARNGADEMFFFVE